MGELTECIGMLGSEETIIALAEKIVKLSIPIVVVDPVGSIFQPSKLSKWTI